MKKAPRNAALFLLARTSVVPEQCQQQDDRQRDAEQPKQCTSSKAHGSLLLFTLK
jgi:hypothetical protein